MRRSRGLLVVGLAIVSMGLLMGPAVSDAGIFKKKWKITSGN